MKIRILDRILVALAGLIMLAAGAALAAQLFFGKDVAGRVAQWLTDEHVRVYIIIAGILIFLLGVYCVMLLFRHRGKNGKFIMQRTESGELAISLKALESMVQKCLETHKELSAQTIELENDKGSLVVRICGSVAGGISIPLTVETLQQQIKQYVTACSGVEVKDIRVEIESSGPDATDAPFAIEAPAAKALPKGAEEEPLAEAEQNAAEQQESAMPEQAETAQSESSAAENRQEEDEISAAAAAAAILMDKAPEEDDGRPMHQRLFSAVEEPCVMPMPPKDLEEKKPSEEAKPEEEKTEAPKTEDVKTEEIKAKDEKPEKVKTENTKAEEAEKDEGLKIEEPKAEEPKAEIPKTEEPKAMEPKAEIPKAAEPETVEPKAEKPKAEEPKAEAAEKAEQIKAEEPKAEDTKAEETESQEKKLAEEKGEKGKGFFSSRKKAKSKKAAKETPEITKEGGIED